MTAEHALDHYHRSLGLKANANARLCAYFLSDGFVELARRYADRFEMTEERMDLLDCAIANPAKPVHIDPAGWYPPRCGDHAKPIISR